ncbi:hypothetical protein EVAR_70880_1 [Eumeta japonica]|uniref:Uncharacterized protein n=1 Tax=Eumeta variegata TaxID=151549 RepID=A0A4C2ABH1_EUMVA|nr:hypothetical protein EVAR_70880_1 [Eumeta japonica]
MSRRRTLENQAERRRSPRSSPVSVVSGTRARGRGAPRPPPGQGRAGRVRDPVSEPLRLMWRDHLKGIPQQWGIANLTERNLAYRSDRLLLTT